MKKTALALVFILLAVTLSGCASAEKRYSEFYSLAQTEIECPGLSDSTFVPQGLCVIDDDSIAVCGYMSDGTESRLYLVSGGVVKYVTFLTTDGKNYKEHAGGVAVCDDNLWISSSGTVYRAKLSDVIKSGNKAQLRFVDSFKTNAGGATVFCDGNNLFVGEFYEKKDYPTDQSHVFTTADGKTNHAIVSMYVLDEEGVGGVVNTIPAKIFSVREKVQGLAVSKQGTIVLSCSYGRKNNSGLYFYSSSVFDKAQDTTMTVDGVKVGVWILDDTLLTKHIVAPSMTEGIDIDDDKMFILFESYAQKYRDTALFPHKDIWSMTVK